MSWQIQKSYVTSDDSMFWLCRYLCNFPSPFFFFFFFYLPMFFFPPPPSDAWVVQCVSWYRLALFFLPMFVVDGRILVMVNLMKCKGGNDAPDVAVSASGSLDCSATVGVYAAAYSVPLGSFFLVSDGVKNLNLWWLIQFEHCGTSWTAKWPLGAGVGPIGRCCRWVNNGV